jgi:hypothetical protein
LPFYWPNNHNIISRRAIPLTRCVFSRLGIF